MTLARFSPKTRGEVIEDLSVTAGTWSCKGVRKPIVRSADPGGFGTIVVFDLIESTNPRHAETIVERRSTPAEQIEATLIVSFDRDVHVTHA